MQKLEAEDQGRKSNQTGAQPDSQTERSSHLKYPNLTGRARRG